MTNRAILTTALALFVFNMVYSFAALARPQNPSGNDCWIDSATGQAVKLVPAGLRSGFDQLDAVKTGQAYIPGLKRNVVRDPSGNWIDSATGEAVNTIPAGLRSGFDQLDAVKTGQAYIPGISRNVVRVPCPPAATQTSMSGLYIGGELAKNSAHVHSTETSATTGVITNQFSDSGDPVGGGVVAGWNFRPLNNNVVIGPFASFDALRQTVNHNFPAGTFLGTTTHWFVTAGAKAGYEVTPGLLLYGLAGASWVNHNLNISFVPGLASQNATTPGFTLGLGGEWQLGSLPKFGAPIAVFAQYQHTWWSSANFYTPASSPAFNYAFKREDDMFKVGVNFYFSPSLPSVPVVAKY